MQRKYLLIVLAFALISGMALAALPRVEAHDDPTGVYIYFEPHIIPGTTGPMLVNVMIDTPVAWDNTAAGIVGWAMSVRVDPRMIDVFNARRGQPEIATLPSGGTPMGFLENFLVRNGYTWYDLFFGWQGEKTTFYAPGTIDATTGTMLDFSEQIEGYGSLGVGAGGGPYVLCQLLLIDADGDSTTGPSVIDLFGPPRPPIIVAQPMYLTVDGTWHEAEFVEDGAYIADTPATMYFDSGGYTGGSPLYTDWHELWPVLCQWWTMESWEDNDDGVLSESDQVDLVQTDGSDPGAVIWGHVVWVNPTPVAGDGMADLIIEVKVPEFPLGMTPILVLMLAIPVVYLWRRKE